MLNERLVEIFKCLADPARLRIIGLMVEEPRCGQELAGELKLAPATVSHHLRRLQQAGLLRERRDGVYVFYELDHQALLWPERVDLEAEESSVDGGEGKPVSLAQRCEDILKR